MSINLSLPILSKIGVILFFLNISNIGYCQDIYDKNHSIQYCQSLFLNQKFDEAFAEFERLKFYKYDNDTIYVRAMLASSFQLDQNKLKTAYLEAKSKFTNSQILTYGYYLCNPMAYKTPVLLNALKLDSTLNDSTKNNIQLSILIKNNQWDQTLEHMIGNQYISSLAKKEIIPIVTNGINTKFKSPALGAGLSAVLPGSGKLYAGETTDGILSMITVSAMLAGVIRSLILFPENPWTYVLSGISVGFYSGNIYGSYHSVKKVNRRKQKTLNEASYKIFNRF